MPVSYSETAGTGVTPLTHMWDAIRPSHANSESIGTGMIGESHLRLNQDLIPCLECEAMNLTFPKTDECASSHGSLK